MRIPGRHCAGAGGVSGAREEARALALAAGEVCPNRPPEPASGRNPRSGNRSAGGRLGADVRTRDTFDAMGCEVLVAGASPAELARIRALFEEWDAVFSRFRPDSELERVNAAGGQPTRVSPLFARMLETALWAADVSDGLVDPTLGRAIVAAGYDRDFAALSPDSRPPGKPSPAR